MALTLPVCHVPWMGPFCDETWASYAAKTYTCIWIIEIALTLALIVTIVILGSRIVAAKGWLPIDVQKTILICNVAICVTFIIRCVDLFGFGATLPYWLSQLMTDLGTAGCYAIVFSVIENWFEIVGKATGKGKKYHPYFVAFYRVSIVTVAIVSIICPIGEAEATTAYKFRMAKFIYFSMVLLLWIFAQMLCGYTIYRILHSAHQQEKRMSSASNEHRTSKRSSRRAALGRIKTLLVIATIAESLAIALQLYSASKANSDKYNTTTNPPDPPTNGTLGMNFVFDLLQFLCCFASLGFFSHVQEGDSRPSQASSSFNTTTHGQSTKGPTSMAELDTIETEN